MISLHQDDQAVSITMEYIMFSAIFIAFFIIVQMSADEILVERPSSIVMENEFSDIGNMIGTTLTDMYLIAPDTRYPQRSLENIMLSMQIQLRQTRS